ncbi:MAG: right-handed parallel beta-helix repeat-containing protein [Acidimicrobiales bacterium]|nr:right-handed parallel beta-helix repeat-containing protein [Acidimicrobiales bacterium]MCB9373410.1 right-handed parallel beta-helix repeat-containing protein [Microthrixaceae bacterium]
MVERPGGPAGGPKLTRRRALAAGATGGAGLWALGTGTAHAEAAAQTTFDDTGMQVVTGATVQAALEATDARLEGTLGGPGVINVGDYGALGDGVTNDMPAVIDAVIAEKSSPNPLEWLPRFDPAVGGVLYFPPGRYLLHGLLTVWYPGLHLVGAGMGVTTLVFHQAGYSGDPDLAPKLWFTDPRFDRRIHDVGLHDLTVTTDVELGPETPREIGDTVLKCFQVDRLQISGVEVHDSPSFGLSIWDCTDVTVDRCYVHDTHIDGIHLASVRRGVVSGCRIDHTGDDGIAVSGGSAPGAEQILGRQVVVSSNVVTRSGSRGIAVFGADGVVVQGNSVSGTHQAGIGVNLDALPWECRNVVIVANHLDGIGLYGEDGDTLWGAGIPYAVGVGTDHGGEAITVENVLVEGNVVGETRNGYLRVEQAQDVTVASNRFHGPVTTEQPAPGSIQQQGSLGQGVMFPPAPPYSGGATPVFPGLRVRRSPRVRLDANTLRPAAGERAVLVEGHTAAEVTWSRVSGNTIDRGAAPPLGTGGADEIAAEPTGVVVHQTGNDVNGLALAPVTTPA